MIATDKRKEKEKQVAGWKEGNHVLRGSHHVPWGYLGKKGKGHA